MLDLDRMGVIGMSFGGAAAGEFCKVDSRCRAGANLDGTQFGRNWDRKVPVPFLMFHNDDHQGGNDYAYLWPLLKHVGFAGSIGGMRMVEILDAVQLEFFDHHLKGQPLDTGLIAGFPEIVARR